MSTPLDALHRLSIRLPTKRAAPLPDEKRRIPGYEVRPGIAFTPVLDLLDQPLTASLNGKALPDPLPRLTDAEAAGFFVWLDDLLRRLTTSRPGTDLIDFFRRARPLPRDWSWNVPPYEHAAFYDGGGEAPIQLVISPSSCRNSARPSRPGGASDGYGCASYIRLNPRVLIHVDQVPLAPEVVVAHEMIHAVQHVSGTLWGAQKYWGVGAYRLPVWVNASGVVVFHAVYQGLAFVSALDEFAAHGNWLALAALQGLDETGGTPALRPSERQLTADRVAAEYRGRQVGDALRQAAQDIRDTRRTAAGITEVRIARALGMVPRPAYNSVKESLSDPPEAAEGILTAGVGRATLPDSCFQRQFGLGLCPELGPLVTWAVDPLYPPCNDDGEPEQIRDALALWDRLRMLDDLTVRYPSRRPVADVEVVLGETLVGIELGS